MSIASQANISVILKDQGKIETLYSDEAFSSLLQKLCVQNKNVKSFYNKRFHSIN